FNCVWPRNSADRFRIPAAAVSPPDSCVALRQRSRHRANNGGADISKRATQNHGQLNFCGSTSRRAPGPCWADPQQSAMKTYSARATPQKFRAQTLISAATLRSIWRSELASVPHRIIKSEINTGASTGPHQGNGSKKRTSQLNKEYGHPHRTFRNT